MQTWKSYQSNLLEEQHSCASILVTSRILFCTVLNFLLVSLTILASMPHILDSCLPRVYIFWLNVNVWILHILSSGQNSALQLAASLTQASCRVQITPRQASLTAHDVGISQCTLFFTMWCRTGPRMPVMESPTVQMKRTEEAEWTL